MSIYTLYRSYILYVYKPICMYVNIYDCMKYIHIKSKIIWDVKRCSPVEVHRRFGGTHCFHLNVGSVSQANNKHTSSKQSEKQVGYLVEVFGEPSSGIGQTWFRYSPSFIQAQAKHCLDTG
jgi:hypothetical protein